MTRILFVGLVLILFACMPAGVNEERVIPDAGCFMFADGWVPRFAWGDGGIWIGGEDAYSLANMVFCEWRDTGIYAQCDRIPVTCPQ